MTSFVERLSPSTPSSFGSTKGSAGLSTSAALTVLLLAAACTRTPTSTAAPERAAAPGQSLSRVIKHLRVCRLPRDPAFRDHRIVDERDAVSTPRVLVTRRGQETGLPRLVVQSSRNGLDVFGPLATPNVVSAIRSAAVGRTAC